MTNVGLVLSTSLLASGPATPTTSNNQPGGQGQEFGSASPVALLVIILLFIAAAFLVWSMTRHLKKVPKSFDPEELAAIEAEERAAESGQPVESGEAGEKPTDTDESTKKSGKKSGSKSESKSSSGSTAG